MIIKNHSELSVRKQCDLLELSRGTLYYEPVPVLPETLSLMNRIDEIYTKWPFFGSPRITAQLKREGHDVNIKRVKRLMRLMNIIAIYPKPKTSPKNHEHKVYPYLLANVTIARPNFVWSTDITYVRLGRGFVYLVAVIDWYSRYVLSWELSNTLETEFCVTALQSALSISCPTIFNTDQGSQFTSQDFVSVLQNLGIQVSMDSRGRALDNIFVERLWRSVKYEDVYIRHYELVRDAYQGLSRYFKFYNEERPHQALNYLTPSEVYFEGKEVKPIIKQRV